MESTTGNSQKKKKIFPTVLHLLTFIYGLLYLIFFVGSFLPSEINGFIDEPFNLEGILVKLLFVVFLIGFFISWKREGLAGLIFIFWWVGMWCLALFVAKTDRGAGVVMGIPLFIFGIGFLISWYNKRKRSSLTPT
jgi:hypothetical protein